MVENLKVRSFVVALLVGLSLFLLRPIFHGKSPVVLGLDIRGGVNLRYELRQQDLPAGSKMSDAIATAEQIFNNRLDALAVKEMTVRSIGDNQIEVAVPGITLAEADAIQKTIESVGHLEFRLTAWSESGVDVQAAQDALKTEIERRKKAGEEVTDKSDFSALTEGMKLQGSGVTFRWLPKSQKLLRDEAQRRGHTPSADEIRWDVVNAWALVRYDPRDGQHFEGEQVAHVEPGIDPEHPPNRCVDFTIKPGRASSQFADFTETNKDRLLTTILDNQVQQQANIHSRIEAHGVLTGGEDGFSQEELTRLVSVIRSGALSARPVLAQKYAQGPSLGEDSINRSLHALIVAFVIIAGFMLVYYRLNGVIADGALVCNLLLQTASMTWLGATLTLPGVAGLILTIGVAVDANILISERIREEMEKGKTIAQAVKNGFDRAWVTIFDSHLTTFISGFFLYQFGTGTIRGFAVTLMIGIVTSLLTGVYFSHTFFGWVLSRGVKTMSMLRMLTSPNLHFLKYAKHCYVASILVTVLGVAAFLSQDEKKYGMDFTGGLEVQVELAQPTAQSEVLALVETKYKNPDVVSVNSTAGKATHFQIKIKRTALEESRTAASGTSPDGGAKDAKNDAKSAASEADVFAGDVAKLFGDRLVKPGVQNLALGEPDDQGRVSVKVDLRFEGDVKKSDLEAAVKRNGVTVDKVDGADVGPTFHLEGRFVRNPEGEERARGLLAPRLLSPDGTRDVLLADPMPAKSYVGPRAGKDLRDSAIRAMLFSLAAIILYARMRFSQYRYGLAAVLALIHDVLVALGAFGIARLFGYKLEVDLTVVAAFLTIIGYSVNDTIVVFDRIRENLPRMNAPLTEVIDRSCNQTLGRTILTSLTVFLSMAILFCFNVGQGNALEAFSFAMMVGVVTGTYSSVYVAAALVVNIANWSDRRKGRSPPTPPAPPAVAAV
jgi:SecD/SecF fusion protein